MCSNRTIVGLKHVAIVAVKEAAKSSNRTIVGLKHGFGKDFTLKDKCSNRTIVGLKQAILPTCSQNLPAAIAPLWD